MLPDGGAGGAFPAEAAESFSNSARTLLRAPSEKRVVGFGREPYFASSSCRSIPRGGGVLLGGCVWRGGIGVAGCWGDCVGSSSSSFRAGACWFWDVFSRE